MKLTSLLVLLLLAGLTPTEASARSRTRMFDPLLDAPMSEGFVLNTDSLFQAFLPGLNPMARPDGLEDVQEKYFDQKLNWADPADARTYRQRYYVYSGHASGPGAPVVLYIGGEGELVARSFMGRFVEKTAETLGAHIVAVEHRYYGKSQPFAQLTPANLEYLSTENALADLANLQRHLMAEQGMSGKWIAMGGSYPGSLSAFYRLKHPELVVGSLASSAPVQAKNAFEEYDAHVTQVLPPVCADALRKVVAAAEAALSSGDREAVASFKERFNAGDVVHDGDFLYILADVTADAVQYGYPSKLCDQLMPAENPVQAYASYVREFLRGRGTTAADFSPAVAGKLGAEESEGMRQWTWQSCREYGYWQDGHHDRSKSVRSARINAEYDRELCSRFFGLNDIADEAATNARYYLPLQDPAQASRILFTNGSDDPWSELSITHERGNDTNPNTQSFMIQGKAHCSDLRALKDSDPESLKQARNLFLQLATDWVK